MIWLCHAIRFLSLVVSCACSVSLRLSSDWCLLFKFTNHGDGRPAWSEFYLATVQWFPRAWKSRCANPQFHFSGLLTFRSPSRQRRSEVRFLFPLFSLERFSLIALSRSFTLSLFCCIFSIRELVTLSASCIFLVGHFQLMFPVLPCGIKTLHFLFLFFNDEIVTLQMLLSCNSL